MSCFTLSLKCFSSDSDSCPNVGIRALLQFLPAEGRSSPTNTPVSPLVPSSSWVLHGSICSFPLVRYSCPLSAGVLPALLCLKVCSWCIRGERGTPCPPTPPSSCSPLPGYSFTFAYLFCMPLPITFLFGNDYLLTTTKSIIFCPSALFLLWTSDSNNQ